LSLLQRRSVYYAHWGSWDVGTLRYFTDLATRYDIDPPELLSALLQAERKHIAPCWPPMIRLDTRTKDCADDHPHRIRKTS